MICYGCSEVIRVKETRRRKRVKLVDGQFLCPDCAERFLNQTGDAGRKLLVPPRVPDCELCQQYADGVHAHDIGCTFVLVSVLWLFLAVLGVVIAASAGVEGCRIVEERME
jgi:hypothetical protein